MRSRARGGRWCGPSLPYIHRSPREPQVLARHFPSSKCFVLPSAPQIVASSATYEPATVISISENEDWLFAYFPGRGGDGAGCLWRKDAQLDSWQIREFWSFDQGAGAVSAEWTCTQREWVVTESGSSARLPPRGPMGQLPITVLLLVTQDHCIAVCYLPPYTASLKIMRACLLQTAVTQESHPGMTPYLLPSVKHMVAASIYMGYQVLPPQRVHESTYNAMDLNMPLDLNDVGPSYEVPLTPEWDLWGEDSMINVCEIPHLEAQQTYDDKVLDFIMPAPSRDSLLVGFMNLSGSVPHVKQKVKGGTIGTMRVLKFGFHLLRLPHLYHTLPRRRPDGSRPFTNALVAELHNPFITAIRSRSSPSDVAHALTNPAIPVEAVVDVLSGVLSSLSRESPGMRDVWTAEDEVAPCGRGRQREPSRSMEDDPRHVFSIRVSQRICDVLWDQLYDLGDIWHLVCFSTWFIEFLEGLLRECVLAGDESSLAMNRAQSSTSLNASIFVHLVHPYSLERIRIILGYIKRFRDHVASLTAKGENAQIARDVLLDVVDCSGIDLERLSIVFTEVYQSLKGGANDQDLQQTLLSGMPHLSLSGPLRGAVEKIASNGGINRARLFIKPGDLVDGVARLSLVDKHLKDKQRDVVSKGLLLHLSTSSVCVCCEGRSETNQGDPKMRSGSAGWRVWERQWQHRCVCGGAWWKL
ncbi:uncharacterized protein B0H18DRAFT_1207647 [Fomitopsis serialis]|uniref:uncharacterized protein n=1 Tax=Fomitopsis serialis TaxID=139415 RepID=UPI0020078926|nr:uncharacterized protein B0H18DRAFT_1207647 [Neoantrodia serialis]KAH9935022.1 hypothetical protein B0H18DRAFT_1207647 [Neoantrodia serialis]